MATSQIMLSQFDSPVSKIAILAGSAIEEGTLSTSYSLVDAEYSQLGRTDQVAKGPEMLERIKEELRRRYSSGVIQTRNI
jgi:hypothetical protein